jgi:hypothetical protein
MWLNILTAMVIPHMASLPPVQYREDKVIAIIQFTYPKDVDKGCGGSPEDDPTYIVACTKVGGPKMLAPHPCLYPEDPYARVLCHELGHISGWPADHSDPSVKASDTPRR